MIIISNTKISARAMTFYINYIMLKQSSIYFVPQSSKFPAELENMYVCWVRHGYK